MEQDKDGRFLGTKNSSEDLGFIKSKLNLNKEEDKELLELCRLIALKGYNVGEASRLIENNKTLRSYQYLLKQRTEGKITLRDLRIIYELDHPEVLYERLRQKKRKGKYRRDYIPPRVRYKILLKYNFRCFICGRDASETKLHVDHIIPVSKGGKSGEDNLRCLCSICNLGKSDILEDI